MSPSTQEELGSIHGEAARTGQADAEGSAPREHRVSE